MAGQLSYLSTCLERILFLLTELAATTTPRIHKVVFVLFHADNFSFVCTSSASSAVASVFTHFFIMFHMPKIELTTGLLDGYCIF